MEGEFTTVAMGANTKGNLKMVIFLAMEHSTLLMAIILKGNSWIKTGMEEEFIILKMEVTKKEKLPMVNSH